MKNYSLEIFDNVFDRKYILELNEEAEKIPNFPNNIANRKTFPYGTQGTHNILGNVIFEKKGKYIYESKCPIIFMEAFTHIANNVIKKNFELISIHTNMQVMSMEGSYHRDGNIKSVMIYTTSYWEKEWGGEFEYLENENATDSKLIEYVPGRVLYFDGNILHKARAPLIPYVYRHSILFRCKLT
jgi:hypothetical protein